MASSCALVAPRLDAQHWFWPGIAVVQVADREHPLVVGGDADRFTGAGLEPRLAIKLGDRHRDQERYDVGRRDVSGLGEIADEPGVKSQRVRPPVTHPTFGPTG